MKATANGTPVTIGDNLDIQVEVDPAGETLPPVHIAATGGRLDVHASAVTKTGDIVVHVFGAVRSNCPSCLASESDAQGWAWAMQFIQSLGFVTQSAHLFAGLGVTHPLARLVPGWLAPLLFLGLWACPKEIVFDASPWGEGHGSPDWLDLTCYAVGAALASAVLFFTR